MYTSHPHPNHPAHANGPRHQAHGCGQGEERITHAHAMVTQLPEAWDQDPRGSAMVGGKEAGRPGGGGLLQQIVA